MSTRWPSPDLQRYDLDLDPEPDCRVHLGSHKSWKICFKSKMSAESPVSRWIRRGSSVVACVCFLPTPTSVSASLRWVTWFSRPLAAVTWRRSLWSWGERAQTSSCLTPTVRSNVHDDLTNAARVLQAWPPTAAFWFSALSGGRGGAVPLCPVLQPRPVLLRWLAYVRARGRLRRVCGAQRGASQEANGRRPLWLEDGAGTSGNVQP